MGKTQVIKTASIELNMVAHTFSPSSQRKQQNDLCGFKASFIYRAD